MGINVELIKVNNGRYDVSIIKNDEYIGRTIACGYEWDGWMRTDIQANYKPGTDIIDIGANIGYNTLMFSDYGYVHAFEPVYHEIVKINVKNNNLKNGVHVYSFALSNERKFSNIYLPNIEHSKNGLLNYGGTGLTASDTAIPFPVPCERLDDVYSGTPSIIKIDVEGHELQTLQGAINTIKKHKPMLMVEIYNFSEDDPVHKFIKELGYEDPQERPEWMFLYRAKDIFSTM